jgi:butyryl-CoA dehydrogenase
MEYAKTWPNLDENQIMLMDQIQQFAQKVVAPVAAHHDETGEFPANNIKQMAEMGLMGMMVEDQWGGAGLDTVTYAMAMEAISAACASTGVIMSVNNSLVCYPIQAFGNDLQKQKFLKPLASGEKLGCFALSEPGHGSDPAGLKCRAEKVPGGYKINGSKNCIREFVLLS